MKIETIVTRKGFDGKKCFVHARCCFAPDVAIATSQYLDVSGSDLFSGLYMSKSYDGGKTWSEFEAQEGLKPVVKDEYITVGCDATPMYHKKTGKILLLGHTAEYQEGLKHPTGNHRNTFYSVYDEKSGCFTKMRFLEMPQGFECCGNGSGQSIELENGELLVPVYYTTQESPNNAKAMVLRCSFDGVDIKVLEMGKPLSFLIDRGLDEPSIVCHKGEYFMTIRNDECGLVAKSKDGLNYDNVHLWQWDDGSILQNYNTQQHWMTVGDDLYLVYTRRGANNDHVFRHRAPLFASRVENMKLVRNSEIALVPQRGARMGNFGVTRINENTSAVMVSEWMQPSGCEKYGSDNSIFLSFVTKD